MANAQRLPLTLTPRQDIPFLFESYRELIRDLGAVDGLGAGLTLASSNFIDSARETGSAQQFALEAAKRYKITTYFVDFNRLNPHLTQLLIVGTYQQVEDFLTSFRKEQHLLGRKWRVREDDESPLQHTLDCISGGFANNVTRIWKERFELHDYYRKIRNSFLHLSINRKKIFAEYERVEKYREKVLAQYQLSAPNVFHDLTFDDHLLFTRLTKYIATDLCRLAPPLTGPELIRYMAQRAPDSVLTTLLSHRGEPNTLKRNLRGWFKDKYNFNLGNHPDEEAEIMSWLVSVPTRRDRKKSDYLKALDAARLLAARID